MAEVCGQEILLPSSPDKAACYAAAAEWLKEQCPLCGGNETCEANIRTLYLVMIWDCDHPAESANTRAIINHLKVVFGIK